MGRGATNAPATPTTFVEVIDMSERTCLECGGPLPPTPPHGGPPRKYCKATCRYKASAKRNAKSHNTYRRDWRSRQPRTPTPTGRTCLWCGVSIDHRRRDAKYCGDNHAARYWYALNVPRPTGRICLVCGDAIADSVDTKRIYCKVNCQAAATRIRRYGIDLADYFRMEREQNHRCAICGCEENDSRQGRWCIDHDHATGAVRGLLCSNCNWLLGHAKDSAATLRAAAAYLERSSAIP